MFSLDSFWDMVIAVILAVGGGFARLLNLKDKQALNWLRVYQSNANPKAGQPRNRVEQTTNVMERCLPTEH